MGLGGRLREEPGSGEQNPVAMTESPRAQRKMELGMWGGLPGRRNQGTAWQVEVPSREPRHKLQKMGGGVSASLLLPPEPCVL